MTDTLERDRTLVLDRILPAPRDAVWDAWTDPARLPQWWGPRGFTCRTHEMDLAEGGQWRFDMIGPDGTVFPNRHRYRRITPKTAIDYTLDDDGTGTHHFEAEVRFAKAKDGTRVTLTMIFPNAAERDAVEGFGAVAHGYTTLDCLTEAAAPDTLSLTRILDAPRDRVWRCWTEPEEMAHWFFPDGIDIVTADFDPLKGGDWRTVMKVPETGHTMAVRGRFEAVEAPERLVFSHGWEDETGAIATLTRVTVSLHDLNGKTRLSLVQQGLTSEDSREGHREGWGQTLDHLAAHLDG